MECRGYAVEVRCLRKNMMSSGRPEEAMRRIQKLKREQKKRGFNCDFCKYTIKHYLIQKYGIYLRYYEECRDECGKLTKKTFLYQTKSKKRGEAIVDQWEEVRYVVQDPIWRVFR